MSQPSTSRSSRGLDDVELDSVSNDVVRFLINKSVSKIPIKRSDILKFLNNIRDGLSRNIAEILIAANKKLVDVYGFKLVELNGKTHYILVMSDEDHTPATDGKINKNCVLLNATLAHIFMNGGYVKEDAMWRFLEKANLMEDSDVAVKKLLTHQFTRELYLNYIKTGELDNPKFVFKWGARATEEMPKLFLLNKIAGAFNRTPDHWFEQHKEAQKSEENAR